ncbi:hypothetical protein GCM10009662_82940 [Catellatospora coxensis]|uniref:Uncharacterized protein n=1 Tax=Catellatospora coxensis TaxID=310354 RepID=A0A8J3KYM5_9ACTN|nr:hypothetical protein Cco03nite_78080 [Catellatospora coxensis]
MQTTAQRWSTAFAWLGTGTLVGVYAEGAALWIGVGLLGAGLLLTLAGLGGDATLLPTPVRTRPDGQLGLDGLGTRVQQILRLAEEQAGDHLAEARREAEQIVAAAHAEAARVRGGHP